MPLGIALLVVWLILRKKDDGAGPSGPGYAPQTQQGHPQQGQVYPGQQPGQQHPGQGYQQGQPGRGEYDPRQEQTPDPLDPSQHDPMNKNPDDPNYRPEGGGQA